MVYFNHKFQSLDFPSIDGDTIAEFQRAHELVRAFSLSDDVEKCFAAIRESFSADTRQKYGREVGLFVCAATKELEERVHAAGRQACAAAGKREEEVQEAVPTKKMKSTDPEDPEELFQLGLRYYNAERSDWKEGARLFKIAADKGHAKAQCEIAECYFGRGGTRCNEAKAIKYLLRASEQGYGEAEYKLALLYEEGRKVLRDKAKMVEYLQKAVSHGQVEAQYKLGMCYFWGDGISQDMAKGCELFRKAAEQRDPIAQYWLAKRYSYFEDIPQSQEEIVKYLHKAADQGNVNAQYKLSAMYFRGDIVQIDWSKALEYYHKAVGRKHIVAQEQMAERSACLETLFELGLRYLEGKGIFTDEFEGASLLKIAADHGHVKAQYRIGKCFNLYCATGVLQDQERAVEYYRKAADQGDSDAQFMLGKCYEAGNGVKSDSAKALEYYQKAACQGHGETLYRLYKCYFQGDLCAVDEGRAFEYLLRAVDQKYPLAQYALADHYLRGEYVPQDIVKAIEYFRKAADHPDYRIAQKRLVELYLKKEGTPLDWAWAFTNYDILSQEDRVRMLDMLEEEKFIEKTISLSSLSFIPTDLLVRFFVSKPFYEMKSWLEETVLTRDGNKTRLETLPSEQKKAILFYFIRNESSLLLGEWVGFLYACTDEVESWQRGKTKEEKAEELFKLGLHYLDAEDSFLDTVLRDKGVCFLKIAADQGCCQAQWEIAKIFCGDGGLLLLDNDKASEYFRKAADQGDPSLQYSLAKRYKYGDGIREDKEKAIEYFQKAADQGEARAQYEVGSFYNRLDKVKAIKYYQAAADQEHFTSQEVLGNLYLRGEGLPQDWVKALLKYKHITRTVRISLLYKLEFIGFLEEALFRLPLSAIPTELLVRFLGEKPFALMKKWLLETISTDEGDKTRLETLLPRQKKAILFRFTRFESALPLREWMELFSVSEEEVGRELASLTRVELPDSFRSRAWVFRKEQLDRRLERDLDVNDPFSLFSIFLSEMYTGYGVDDITRMLVDNLFVFGGRETQICGGRTFISWGGAEPESSVCVSQDAPSLHGTYRGQPITIYPRGVFNDVTFAVASVSLKRIYYELLKSSCLGRDDIVWNPLWVISDNDCEIDVELTRIAENLLKRFPQLVTFARRVENPFVDIHLPEELQRERTFAALLKATYQRCFREYQATRAGTPAYDCNNPVHRHAFLYLSLLTLARQAKIARDGDETQITLTRNVFFRLKSLRREDFKVSPEDNPGINNLASYASDYPLHTLSPITPADITPEDFEAFVAQVQSLSDEGFKVFCDSCKKFLSVEISDEMPYEEYFQVWKSLSPKEVMIEDAFPILTRLAKNYYGRVDVLTETLIPNHMYLLDRDGVGRFARAEEVPEFIRHLGSFASALCKFYTIVEPDRHNGDCAINSFLLGLHGAESYERRERNLSLDIREFRESVVRYATDHLEALKEEFGIAPISLLLANFSRNSGEESWTTREVWTIASRMCGRTIRIFNSDCHGNYFRTDERGEVVPFDEKNDIFLPEGSSSGKPINLLYWGPHYCFMRRRE